MRLSAALAAISGALLAVAQDRGQIFEISDDTKNRDRYVRRQVNKECGWPDEVHSVPFGNLGVDTESDNRIDGHQFQGWCRY